MPFLWNIMRKHGIFSFINNSFNRVDKERLKLVGADRMCAEWILKNGGAIRTSIKPNHLLTDYNLLPNETIKFQLIHIDASDTAVTAIGFDHLQNCHSVDTIILHKCWQMENAALERLTFVKNTLGYLQISECPLITANGLIAIKELRNLRKLICWNLANVENIAAIETELKKNLPNCHFEFNEKK